jgi:hypothetical protein
MTQTCGAAGGVTLAGAPCKSWLNLSPTSGKCLMHDEERVAERARATSVGGKASKAAQVKAKAANPANAPKAPKTLDDAVAVASWITRAVLTGEIDVRVAEAAVKAVRQFQLGEEKRGYEVQIKTMRAEIKKLRTELDAAHGKGARSGIALVQEATS